MPRPQDFLRFIQLGTFQQDWEDLGLVDDDLAALEVLIMAEPDGPAPQEGTSGFRLINFLSPLNKEDRPNGILVGYAYFPASSVAALLVAADLNEPLGLNKQTRNQFKSDIEFIEERLKNGD